MAEKQQQFVVPWREGVEPGSRAESYDAEVGSATGAHGPARWRTSLADALLGAESVDAVLRTLTGQAVGLTRARAAAVLLRDESAGVLRLAAQLGDVRRLLDDRDTLPLDALHPATEPFRSGQPRFDPVDVMRARWPSPADGDRYHRTDWLASVPLVVAGRTLAVLLLPFAGEREGSAAFLTRLDALATLGAHALDRAQLSAAALAAGEAKASFLAMMSHELRTPLNAIMGYTGLLADEVVGPINETQRDHLHRVQGQAHHLLTLIEELLSLSRAEARPGELQFERVAPDALLRDLVPVLAPAAARKGLRLDWRVTTPLEPVITDPDMIRQVLTHLLSNAIKFTERGGVDTEVRQRRLTPERPSSPTSARVLEFVVRDSGVGIPAVDHARLFEPFWQAERVHARRAPGTGLGLHVARRIARLLGGDILVESEVGEGSAFTLRLPLRDE